MTEPTDIELLTTEILLTELMRRFDHAIFSGFIVTVDNKDGTGDNYAQHVWKGCSLTCAGLAGEIQARILANRIDREEEDP